MKITTDKTNYLLVSAGDSRCSGTDYAVITIDDTLLDQLQRATKALEYAGGGTFQMIDCSCTYLEVEKLDEGLFQEIEKLKQDIKWEYGYIGKDLHGRLMASSVIETWDGGTLNVSNGKFSFELYEEADTEGYYLVFRTNDVPVNCILQDTGVHQ
jgi:hypothetical protein